MLATMIWLAIARLTRQEPLLNRTLEIVNNGKGERRNNCSRFPGNPLK
jgi:hypothetical protein